MFDASEFKSVVFAGGGSRCMWQAGFWEVAAPALGLSPEVVSGTSAGAGVACMAFSGNIRKGLDFFKRITGENKKNFYFSNLISNKRAFPHYEMYRDLILEVMDDDGFNNIQKGGPEIRILFARPPKYLGPRSATFVGLLSYVIEKHSTHVVHPVWAKELGFGYEVISAQDCSTKYELADLVLHASCTPPILPILKRGTSPVLDGGIIDNVPVTAIKKGEGKTLCLLARKYPEKNIPDDSDRLYIYPSEPVPVSKWDYTSPEKLQATFDQGRIDAERFVRDNRG